MSAYCQYFTRSRDRPRQEVVLIWGETEGKMRESVRVRELLRILAGFDTAQEIYNLNAQLLKAGFD
ncbi:hypothetical protein [Microcoleus sp. A006_D1]|uniref:hypothetical protein n=1 Tax=Microcoleus sp. A006_D1 TaxID=3055267 RepID=UPI002FD2CF1B